MIASADPLIGYDLIVAYFTRISTAGSCCTLLIPESIRDYLLRRAHRCFHVSQRETTLRARRQVKFRECNLAQKISNEITILGASREPIKYR